MHKYYVDSLRSSLIVGSRVRKVPLRSGLNHVTDWFPAKHRAPGTYPPRQEHGRAKGPQDDRAEFPSYCKVPYVYFYMDLRIRKCFLHNLEVKRCTVHWSKLDGS